jgi:hypothetical protein
MVLPRAIALVVCDPNPHVRAHAIGLAGRWVHTNDDVEAVLLRVMKSDRAQQSARKPVGTFAAGRSIGGPLQRVEERRYKEAV